MDIKLIKQLGELAKKLDLNLLEVSEGDVKIKIERKMTEQAVFLPQALPAMPKPDTAAQDRFSDELDFNDLKEIKSPMVGVFYSSSSPAAPPFVSVGETVKKGQILCIIEAMKVMNEIVSDFDGEIVDICAGNEQVVEYGQTLFKIH